MVAAALHYILKTPRIITVAPECDSSESLFFRVGVGHSLCINSHLIMIRMQKSPTNTLNHKLKLDADGHTDSFSRRNNSKKAYNPNKGSDGRGAEADGKKSSWN